MKSQFQTLSFLAQYTPSSELDRDMILSFLEKRYQITPRTAVFAPTSDFLPLDAQSFIQWLENGYSATEMAKFGTSIVILGNCTLDSCQIIGEMTDGAIQSANLTVKPEELSEASEGDIQRFQIALLDNKLQFNPDTMSLESKYIPEPNEKVLFHNRDHSIKGLGIIRNIDPSSHEVEMYCYFIYPTKQHEASLGYSMHEMNIVNLHEYVFEPLLEDEKRFSSDDGISAYRRLKRELEKKGKVWRDKIRRIEPITYQLEKGQKYWYISDKMKVVQETEKGTPTSHFRYLSGNYFTDYEAAIRMLGRFHELLRDYLASDEWPEISDE